jgi:hypothetical protein
MIETFNEYGWLWVIVGVVARVSDDAYQKKYADNVVAILKLKEDLENHKKTANAHDPWGHMPGFRERIDSVAYNRYTGIPAKRHDEIVKVVNHVLDGRFPPPPPKPEEI